MSGASALLLPSLVYDFKSNKHQLPLARIKKIMKSDEDVRMISAEAPVLFAKACELFILVRFHPLQQQQHISQRCAHSAPRLEIFEAMSCSDTRWGWLVSARS